LPRVALAGIPEDQDTKPGARPEHAFAPVIGSTGCVGHLIWTARGVRAFDAGDREVGTFATMDEAAALLEVAAA
jgi:hypothetical protein